jgi:WD40 repeat protein
MLAKKPEDRYQTPAEVAAAITPFADPQIPTTKRGSKIGWLVGAAAAAVVVLGLFLAAGVVVYRIQTDRGELVITTDNDDVEVIVKQGGNLVDVIDTKTNKRLTLRSGVYDLELKGGRGLKLDLSQATLKRGDVVLAKIERLPKIARIEPQPKPAPPFPDPNPPEEKVGEVRQFVGHADAIGPVAFSPDGQIVFTGAFVEPGAARDCDVQLWNASTGDKLRRLKGHRAGIFSAALSRDGKLFAAGGYEPDASIIVWDVKSGAVLHRLPNSPSHVVSNVAFSKDGRLLFFCGVDHARRRSTLRVFDLETGKEKENHFDEHATALRGMAVSHDGRLLAACPGSGDSVIRLWEIQTGKLIKQFPRTKKKEEDMNNIIFSLDDSQLITGDYVFGLRLWDVRTGKEIPRFDNHGERVFGLDLSPDGRLVACGYGPTVGIWDLETGKEIDRLTGHGRGVNSVAFSPNGRLLLSSGGAENLARLWRLPAPQPSMESKPPLTPPQPKVTEITLLHRVPIPGRWDYFTSTAVTDDGKFFAADVLEGKDAANKEVAVFDGNTGKELYRLPGWYGQITTDAKRLVFTDNDSNVHIHELASGKKLHIIRLPAWFYGHTLLPGGRHGMAWTKGDVNHLYDLHTGKIVHTWRGAAFGARTDDGRLMLVKPAGYPNFVAWDVQKDEPTSELAHLTKYPHAGHLFPGSKQALISIEGKNMVLDIADGKMAPFPVRSWPPNVRSGTAQLDVRINLLEDGNARYCTFDYLTGKETAAIQLPKGERFDRGDAINLSPRGGYACVETNKAVYLLRLAGPAAAVKKEPEKVGEVRVFEGHNYVVRRVFFADEGRRALSAGFDKVLILWDVATAKEVRRFDGHTDLIDSAALSRDGRFALSGGADGTVRVWEVATGKELRRFKGNPGRVVSVAISPDGKRALTGSHDRTMRLWDIETGSEVRRFNGHVNAVQAVAFSPDGLRALSGSWEKGQTRTLKMFDVETGRDLGLLFDRYAEGIQDATFSQDGARIASGGLDRRIWLWDAASGKRMRSFDGHLDVIKSVAFSRDGRRALSGSDDRTVRLWDVVTGEELHRFFGHTAIVTSVAFSPDGLYALSGSDDKTMRLWRLPDAPAAK